MAGSLKVITGPTVEPLTVAEVQQHLRIGDDSAEEFLLESYLVALRAHAEKLLDLAFCTQTLEWALDCFPVVDYATMHPDLWAPCWQAIALPRPPLQSVTSVTYLDTAGVSQVLDPSLYLVDTRAMPGRILPAYQQSWPATRWQPNAVVVRYVAGSTSAETVPEDQKQMLRLAAGTLNEFRESIVTGSGGETLPHSTEILEQFFAPYRNALAV